MDTNTKKHIIIFLLFFLIGNFSVFSQSKSGLIIAGGPGNFSNAKETGLMQEIIELGGTKKLQYKFNVSIGYKFRIQPQNISHFWDIDLYAGLKRFNAMYNYYGERSTANGIISYQPSASWQGSYYYFAFNPSYNYKIYNDLHIGAGIEPTMYYADGQGKWKFDILPTLRVGYDFKHFDVAVGYKIGLLNAMESNHFSSGNLNDIQLQLFIPF